MWRRGGGGGGGEGGIIGLSHIVKKDTQAECGKYTCGQNVCMVRYLRYCRNIGACIKILYMRKMPKIGGYYRVKVT